MLEKVLWVDRVNSIFTQAPVEESPCRNILDFKFIGIKMTRTIIMQENFVNWQKVHSNPRDM